MIAHTHYLPLADRAIGKRAVPMSLHRHNWAVPRSSSISQPYFTCDGFGTNCSQLRVLAFSPSMLKLLGSSASWHELAFLLQGLAALATTLGRAVAWPSLPCNTSWISRSTPSSMCHESCSKITAMCIKTSWPMPTIELVNENNYESIVIQICLSGHTILLTPFKLHLEDGNLCFLALT